MAVKKFFICSLILFALFFLSIQVEAISGESTSSSETTSELEKINKRPLIEQRKNAVREEAIRKRENIKDMIEEKRKEASESLRLKLETFRQRIKQIKDEKKQALLEKIQDKLTNINKRRTDHMISVLERLNAILAKLEEKVGAAKSEGKDTKEAEAAIALAKTKISQVQAAVSDQAGKTYVPAVATEATVRSTVGGTVSQLESDLRAVHKLLIDAKQALMRAVKEVHKLKNMSLISVSPTP